MADSSDESPSLGSKDDQKRDPLANSPLAALGQPPAGFSPQDGPQVMPPPDLPPVRQLPANDPRLQSGGREDGGGGGGGGGNRPGAQSRDPHWAWVPTSVLIACDAYWAAYRKRFLDAKQLEFEEQDEMKAPALATEAMADWDNAHPEDWRVSNYIAFLAYRDMALEPARVRRDRNGRIVSDDRLYRHDLLHFEGVREMVDMEIAMNQAADSRAGGGLALHGAKLRVAALPKNATREQILAAIAEVEDDGAA